MVVVEILEKGKTVTNDITPYFVEDIERQLKATYFAAAKSVDAARVILLLCLSYGIKPVWFKPEHMQALYKEFQG